MMINENDLVAHYSKTEHLEKLLGEGRILLGPVSNLDDPRESTVDWVDIVGIGHTFDEVGWRNAERMKKDLKRQIRLFCTAMPRDEVAAGECLIETSIYGRPRMWSQYGDKFKGFCVLFNKDKLNDAIMSSLDKDDYVISDSIKYFSWLHIVSGGSTIEYGQKLCPSKDKILSTINKNNMLHSIYFKKSMDWYEEREYRWLVFSSKLDVKLVSIQDAIHSVVLGSNFPPEKYEQVKDYCRSLKCDCYALSYNHPKYDLLTFVKERSCQLNPGQA